MSEKKRRTCQICGRPYVPTSNVQKYCPDCRKEMQRNGGNIGDAYRAYKKAGAPGPVTVSRIENPEVHLMDMTETPEEPSFEIVGDLEATGSGGSGGPELEQLVTVETEPKAIDLPDGLAVIEEHAEILRRYYKGELVDRTEFLQEILEHLNGL